MLRGAVKRGAFLSSFTTRQIHFDFKGIIFQGEKWVKIFTNIRPLMRLLSQVSGQFACLQIGFHAVSDRTLIDCLLAVCHLTLREKFPSGGSDFWLNPEILRTHTKSDCFFCFVAKLEEVDWRGIIWACMNVIDIIGLLEPGGLPQFLLNHNLLEGSLEI